MGIALNSNLRAIHIILQLKVLDYHLKINPVDLLFSSNCARNLLTSSASINAQSFLFAKIRIVHKLQTISTIKLKNPSMSFTEGLAFTPSLAWKPGSMMKTELKHIVFQSFFLLL